MSAGGGAARYLIGIDLGTTNTAVAAVDTRSADPRVELMDGTESWSTVAREIDGEEYDAWWQRCVAAFPPYADYVVTATAAGRRIPVFVLERV